MHTLGYFQGWSAVNRAWRKQLKKHNLGYFRASDYYSLRGEFEQFRDPIKYPKPLGSQAPTAALHDLEGVIQSNELAGIAVCIPMEMYNEVRNSEPHADSIFKPDAFQAALMSLFKTCAEYARDEFKPQETMGFYCDDSPLSEAYFRLYTEFKKTNTKLAWFLQGLAHLDDKRCLPLQTADMMAHFARRRYMEYLDDPSKATFTSNPITKARLKKLKVHVIQCWDKDYMLAVLEHEKKRRGLI